MMTVLRYIVLYLFVMNISSGALMYVGASIGSITSYLSFILLLIYYFFVKKGKINSWMIVLGMLYFAFAGLQYYDDTSYFINVTIKYFIVILGGYEVVKRTSNKEFIVVLLLGSITILLHAAVLGGGFCRLWPIQWILYQSKCCRFYLYLGLRLGVFIGEQKSKAAGAYYFHFDGIAHLVQNFYCLVDYAKFNFP